MTIETKIKELKESGTPVNKIAATLNKLKIKTTTGKKWTKSNINFILYSKSKKQPAQAEEVSPKTPKVEFVPLPSKSKTLSFSAENADLFVGSLFYADMAWREKCRLVSLFLELGDKE